MTFTDNVPQSGQTLGNTQVPINNNFAAIKTAQSVNHVVYNDPNEGKHKFLQMPEQVSAPTTAANEAGFYAKVGTNPAESNLFFRGEGSGFEYQLTKSIAASTGNFGNNSAYGAPPAGFTQTGGWTFLPGGLLLQYGFYGKTGALGSTGTIQFPVTFSTAVYSVTDGLNRTSSGDQSVTINVVSVSNFTFKSSSSGSDGIYWQAIGI